MTYIVVAYEHEPQRGQKSRQVECRRALHCCECRADGEGVTLTLCDLYVS